MLHIKQPPSCIDRKITRLNSSHLVISYAVFCLKKKTQLLKRKRGRTPTGKLAVGHQRRGRPLRLDEQLFQKSDDLLSQRGRGRPRWRDARTWLHVHDCCIMHSRKSFLIPNNSHERIFLHVLCLCNSILNLVVPHAARVNPTLHGAMLRIERAGDGWPSIVGLILAVNLGGRILRVKNGKECVYTCC